MAQAIGLKNVVAEQKSGEEEKGKYDFVVSRAVMPLPELIKIVRKNIAKDSRNSIENGVIVLKGGDIKDEIKPFSHIVEVDEISQWFTEDWFQEKYVIYIPI